MWCGVVRCGVVWCGEVWCGVVRCGVVWCGVVRCGVVWCGVVCGPTYIGGQGGVHIVVTGAQLCQDLVESDHLIVAGVGVLQVLGLPGLVLLLHLLHLGHRVAHKGLLQVVLRVVHEVVEALHAQADTQAEKGREGGMKRILIFLIWIVIK